MAIEETNTETSISSVRDAINAAIDDTGMTFDDDSPSIDNEETSETITEDETPSESVDTGNSEVKLSTERTRDQKGRFASQPKDAQSNQSTDSTDQAEQPAPVNPPRYWQKEYHDVFAKAPKEVQDAILKQDALTQQYVGRLTNEVGKARQEKNAYDEVVAPYGYLLEQYGCTAQEAIGRLFEWQHRLESNPVATLREMAESYGVTPQHMIQGVNPETDGLSARERQLAYENAQLVNQMRSFSEMQERSQLQSVIDSWANERDGNGSPLRPAFNALRPQIARYVDILEKSAPQASQQQILQAAYERAVNDVQGFFATQQQTSTPDIAQIKAKTQSAKNAASSLKNEPTSPSPKASAPMSVKDAIRKAARECSYE